MRYPMLDLELLRSFVSVVDAGGFTRAGERVHRTQSTVSQQIRRLEETVGQPLLHRNGKQVSLTEQGERLLSYARRILALEQEAREVVSKPASEGVLRLGMPEDFAVYRLAELLSDFTRSRPGLRLDVRCGLSVDLRRALERGELDLAMFKRDAGSSSAMAASVIKSWPEHLHWITSKAHPVDFNRDPLPLAMSEPGCLYRRRMIHAAESAGRSWHVAYTSPNLPGIQAAVSAGLGVSILPELAILPEHRMLTTKDGFPPITDTEVALIAAPGATPATRRLAEVLAEFRSAAGPRRAA
ncbi:LysR family transcriptional regulator [Rhodoplanes sp. Z2-YC6860]|nr:LysR family transcriptional regulator [Rhodoplanes sp. Z2-YC6860]